MLFFTGRKLRFCDCSTKWKNKQKTIDFIAVTLSDKRIFVDALQYIIDKEDAKLIDFNEKQWIIDKFHALDANQT
ncbi:hypothetical protein WUBG_17480, partial [Wuchereria bancrofti]